MENTSTNLSEVGWRFAVGATLVIGGYVSLGLLPVIAVADLDPGLKGTLATVVSLTPPLSKVAAVAVMGKPGFKFLKQLIARPLRQLRPRAAVSLRRHRIGLALLVLPILLDWMAPFAPSLFADRTASALVWVLAGDLILVAALFILGGDFWDKLHALFRHDSRRPAVLAPVEAAGSAKATPIAG